MNFDSLQSQAEAILAKYEQKRAAILPLLRLAQDNFGYVTSTTEEWVGKLVDVAPVHIHEVVTFYSLYHQKPVGKYHIQVCDNIACALKGSDACLASISERLGIRPGETTKDGKFTLSTVECLCACETGPVMQVNEQYVGPISAKVIDTLINTPDKLSTIPLMFQGTVKLQDTVLSQRFNTPNSEQIETYVRDGGYEAAKKALTQLTPDQAIAEVAQSNLRGLGGAGFPTGKKWSFIPKDTAKPKYLVVNADEGEPGTLKDRYIISKDPHRLIEGIIIAAYATGCKKSYVYIRGEYAEPTRILQKAIDEAYSRGFLGQKIFGTDKQLGIVIHRGAGAYICGEETALLNSLEGYKGFPRLKPPFPAISGLFASPTVINNVETLACVPAIISKGAAWFAQLGVPKAGGTRLYSISGHISKPGVYEASQGITLRELIDAAGGAPNGRKVKAVIPGGISAKILTANELDVKMDFDSLLAAGTMAGSAGIIVMDDSTCIVQALWYASKFFAHESCGQCSPCREGTGWIHKIVTRVLKGEGRQADLDNLLQIGLNMEGRTICVFADAASWPAQSYIRKFRSEFEFHVREKRCDITRAEAAMPFAMAGHHG